MRPAHVLVALILALGYEGIGPGDRLSFGAKALVFLSGTAAAALTHWALRRRMR